MELQFLIYRTIIQDNYKQSRQHNYIFLFMYIMRNKISKLVVIEITLKDSVILLLL